MDKKWLAAMPGALLPVRFAFPHLRSPRPATQDDEHCGVASAAAVILVIAAAGWFALRPPAMPQPLPGDAPASSFSAARAFAHVEAIARTPRPLASQANAQAREYIAGQVRALGLMPQVQEATVQRSVDAGFHNVHVTLAVVHNLVVRLEGSAADHARQPALLLVSHYDSKLATLGAADGGASSAAMLETLRALKAGPPRPYDTIFLFADGEKAGGLGTQAFVEQHRLAPRIDLALRFDNAGNRGPVVLADSSHANGHAMAGWARAVTAPRGSSFMPDVYALTPNAQRIGALAQLDAPVLQFANLDGDTGPLDTPDRLDRHTLQQEGDTMLALAREFTRTPLPRGAHAGQAFVALPFLGVLHYPARFVWPLTRLACLLLAGVCCLAAQRAGVSAIRLVQGAFGFALMAFCLILGTWLLWKELPTVRQASRLLAGDTALAMAFVALSAALFIGAQRLLQRAIGMRAAALGALACIGLALLLVSWAAPGTSYLLAWPLLAALGAIAALHSQRVAALGRSARVAIVLAAALPAAVLVAPALRDAAKVQPPGLALALLALLLGLCVMPLAAIARRFTVRVLVLAALAGLTAASEAAPATAPQPDPLVYYKDMPTWRAWWLARPRVLDPATRRLFPGLAAPRRLIEVFGWGSEDLWYSTAPRTTVAFPDTVMLRSDSLPGRRHVEFMLTSRNKAPNIELAIKGGKPLRSTINGRVLTDEEDFSLAISLYGMGDRPLRIGLDMLGDPIVEIRVEERIPGLPADALPGARDAYLPMSAITVAADDVIFR